MKEKDYFQQKSKFELNVVQNGEGLELLSSLKSEVVQLVIFDPQYLNVETVSIKRDFVGVDLEYFEILKFNINKENSRKLLNLIPKNILNTIK